ncbi:MFS general substrate transporter [Cryphonectria parasitica EP155]|uniref:MFS general substrate transporter n=1 Tax=Cryphonectria parasitica (strain ATCC 38755 / EP155) TaxID=660469 RepID=A0A9P5CN07_CRYP1|nr:MFS general substrate transporter [Cryphonectria parasitica EP155]KAF3764673.1 MFS general substrate transporter [Cryphonectria parasitica EP155]
MAVFLAALDITIVTTALPTIADHFQSTSAFTWVGSAFMLSGAVVAPIWAKLSDIWGRKSILLVAVAIFFLGSTLCATAVSLPMLLIGRVTQGVPAGGIVSLVNIVVGDLFSPRERGKYYAITGVVWSIANTLGPLIGGGLTEGASWRWCFYINLPISGATFIVIAYMLKLETPHTPMISGLKAIDWAGTITLVGGLLMFLLGLEFGGTSHPWSSATVICLLVFGLAVLAAFITIEWHFARNPIVPAHLYANVHNLAILVIGLVHGAVVTENTYFLPLYCQSVLGASPLLSGVLILPFALTMSTGQVAANNYVKKKGRYLDCIYFGFSVMILGLGLFYNLPDSRMWPKIIIYQLITGLGIGCLFQPPLIALQGNLSAQDNATATSSFFLVRAVANAIGVVIGSATFANKMDAQQGTLVKLLGASTAQLFSGASAQANVLKIGTLSSSQRSIVRQVYWMAIRNIWVVAVCFAAVGILFGLLIRHNDLETTHVEVKMGLAGEEARRKILMEWRAGRQQNATEVTAV